MARVLVIDDNKMVRAGSRVILESAGQDQALTNVGYLPYPEQLYLEVCGLIFKDKEESPD